MKTIALRFSDKFAPPVGTIAAHKEMIDKNGYVWYGKLGAPVSGKICDELLENDDPRILLIHSGQSKRYWAHIDRISKNTPPAQEIPSYYRDMADKFSTWFRVVLFDDADKGVMSDCTVLSSGALLSMASRHSMSPYFIIDYHEGGES